MAETNRRHFLSFPLGHRLQLPKPKAQTPDITITRWQSFDLGTQWGWTFGTLKNMLTCVRTIKKAGKLKIQHSLPLFEQSTGSNQLLF